MKQISLYMKNGSTDKVYHMQLLQKDSGYVVNFQYGKRGSTLRAETKTETPVTLEEAELVYKKLFLEKTKKGYTEGESGAVFQSTPLEERFTGITPQLLNEVELDEAEALIEDNSYMVQEKFDGERVMTKCESGKVIGINKKGLSILIPEVVEQLVLSIGRDVTLDGELMGETYHIFDCLSYDGVDLKEMPAEERYKTLQTFCTPVSTGFTSEEKREIFESIKAAELEGVVFKKRNSKYEAGRPASGGNQRKFKFWASATVQVDSVHKSKRSVGVCAYEYGEKVELGSVTIAANRDIPKVGDIVEVVYLYCYKGGKLYQSEYKGVRSDQALEDCTMSQIKFKPVDKKLKM